MRALRWPGAVGAAGVVVTLLAGFNREYTGPGGTCVFWNTRAPHYSVNAKGSEHLTGPAEFTAIDNAFAAWAAPSCTDLKAVSDGQTPRFDITYNPDAGLANPNLNLIVWRPAICGSVVDGGCMGQSACDDAHDCLDDADQEDIALTTFFARSDTGAILSAGIELNDARFVFTTVQSPACDQTCTDAGLNRDGGACGARQPPPLPPASAVNWPCVQFDVQEILTHEVGHFLGFAGSSDAGAVMSVLSPAGDVSRLKLATDDQSAICTVYPTGQPPSTVCDAGLMLPAPGCGCAPTRAVGSGGAWVALAVLGALLVPLWRRRSRQTSEAQRGR